MSRGSIEAPPAETRLSVLIPFAIVTLVWGSTWLVIRDQIAVVPPSWSVTYRFIVAAITLGAYALARGESLRFDAKGYGFAAALGLSQFCMNFNFVYRAEGYITSGLVAVVFAMLVVPNTLLARVFVGQRVTSRFLIGSAVAIGGVALLFLHEARVDPAGPANTLTGIGFTICGILSASTANVMQAGKTAKHYPMAAMLTVAMLIGAVLDAGLAYALTGPPRFDPRLGYIAGIVYLGVFASALAFMLYFRVIRVIGPAKAAYSSMIVPVIAMGLSTVFEGYRWTMLAVVGAVLTGIGLVIALRARSPAR